MTLDLRRLTLGSKVSLPLVRGGGRQAAAVLAARPTSSREGAVTATAGALVHAAECSMLPRHPGGKPPEQDICLHGDGLGPDEVGPAFMKRCVTSSWVSTTDSRDTGDESSGGADFDEEGACEYDDEECGIFRLDEEAVLPMPSYVSNWTLGGGDIDDEESVGGLGSMSTQHLAQSLQSGVVVDGVPLSDLFFSL
mmetsp:Transcript_101356/g.293122  ORF Transcript_101356/g.293122 Transcript_101356/m.293122 type:complete len:195 (-) Transcript_101356:195-779(-)